MTKTNILTLELKNLHKFKTYKGAFSLTSMEMLRDNFCTRSNLIPTRHKTASVV